MKRIITFLLLSSLVVTAIAQQKPVSVRSTLQAVQSDPATWSRFFMSIPHGTTPSIPAYVPDSLKDGSPYYRTTDSVLLVYHKASNTWVQVGMLIDTAGITARLNLKLNKTDTASLSNRINHKINTSLINANNGVAPLDAGGKIPFANLPASLMIYKGVWNAVANTPALSDATGTTGWVYKASFTGVDSVIVNLGVGGNRTFYNGDYAIYNGTIWQKSGQTEAVVSVSINGLPPQQGVVNYTLTTDNISEGSTNKYFTNARTIASTLTGYSSTPGTISSSDNILSAIQKLNGNIGALTTDNISEGSTNKYYTDTRARAALSATSPIFYNSSTGIVSSQAASTTLDGYITHTDWNTFNNKLSTATAASTYVPYSSPISDVNFSGHNFGIGIAPSVALHVVSATEQLRIGYDATHYVSHTVNSAGTYNITTNTNFGINLNSALVTASNNLTVSNTLSVGAKNANITSASTGGVISLGSWDASAISATLQAGNMNGSVNAIPFYIAGSTASAGSNGGSVYIYPGTGLSTSGNLYLGYNGTSNIGNVLIPSLTVSKVVFTGIGSKLTSTGPGTGTKFIMDDGSFNSATYISTETDPTVPIYSKSLTAFSVIKTSTDALYQPLENQRLSTTNNVVFNSLAIAQGQQIIAGNTGGVGSRGGSAPVTSTQPNDGNVYGYYAFTKSGVSSASWGLDASGNIILGYRSAGVVDANDILDVFHLKFSPINGNIITDGVLTAGTTIADNAPQTTVGGSTSGSILASQPMSGNGYKIVWIWVNSVNGTATYTYPVAFTTGVGAISGSATGVTLDTSSNSQVVVTGTGSGSGLFELKGY